MRCNLVPIKCGGFLLRPVLTANLRHQPEQSARCRTTPVSKRPSVGYLVPWPKLTRPAETHAWGNGRSLRASPYRLIQPYHPAPSLAYVLSSPSLSSPSLTSSISHHAVVHRHQVASRLIDTPDSNTDTPTSSVTRDTAPDTPSPLIFRVVSNQHHIRSPPYHPSRSPYCRSAS